MDMERGRGGDGGDSTAVAIAYCNGTEAKLDLGTRESMFNLRRSMIYESVVSTCRHATAATRQSRRRSIPVQRAMLRYVDETWVDAADNGWKRKEKDRQTDGW